MSVMIKCNCGRQFGVMERHIGKKGRCPHCGTVVLLQPEGGSAPAAAPKSSSPAPASKTPPPADKRTKVAPAAGGGKAKADPAAAAGKGKDDPAPAARKGKVDPSEIASRMKVDPDQLVSMRTGAAPVSAEGEPDNTSQMAGIRHVVQRFCPTCGARYNEGAARCSHCHAPLSKEEIAAAEAAKKPPLIPWLPNIYLSTRAKQGLVLVGILALVGIVYLFMRPSLQRKARLQTELTLVENALTVKTSLGNDSLQALSISMPRYVGKRPETLKAFGRWERRSGAGVFIIGGSGTYDLTRRELVLTSAEGLQYRTIAPPVLQLAARAGDISFVRQLLNEPGCDVNQTDAQGTTALHAAAGAPGDQVEIVRLLLERDARDKVVDERGLTPSAIARSKNNAKVVRALGGGQVLEPGL